MMDKDTLILALQKKLKEGIIEAIEEVEKQYLLNEQKKHPS
jgi:hypothetical protein